MNEGTNKQVF